jgi:hypothetical protein
MKRLALLFGAFLMCTGCGAEEDISEPEALDEYRRRTPTRSVVPPAAPEEMAAEPASEAPFIDTQTTNEPRDPMGDAAETPEMVEPMTPPPSGADEPTEGSMEEGAETEETAPTEMAADDDYIFDPAADNVRAQFEFNGTAQDVSESQRDGILIGGEFVGTDFGQGLRVSDDSHGFDWSDHSVFLTHPYSIEFVFTPEDDSATVSKLFSHNDEIDDGWYLYRAGFRTYPIEGVTAGSEMMPFGQQTYLAIVSTSETEIEVFIDGQRVTDAPIASQIAARPEHAVFFRDDANVGRYETLFAVIDGMRVSSVSRTAAEIQAVQTHLQTR